jgi:uncharacterized protein YbbK (DUF523 family)
MDLEIVEIGVLTHRIKFNNVYMKVLVSACVLGLNTRYDGKSEKNSYDGKSIKNETLIDYLKGNKIDFYPLCAEQLGGLATPREPCEIEQGFTAEDILNGKGRILTKSGKDVTDNFLRGCNLVLKFCKEFEITHAILENRSPTCGFTKVYDGTFSGNLIDGKGVLAQLLVDNGIEILTIK